MAGNNGWIKLHRSIQDHWVWENPKMLKYWIDILIMVNHDEGKVLVNGKLLFLKPGQKLTSYQKLATRWGTSKSHVRRILTPFLEDGMITIKTLNCGTVLSVVNYLAFQAQNGEVRNAKGNADGNADGNGEGNADGTQTRRSKKDIKKDTEKDIKNSRSASRGIELWKGGNEE